MLSGSRIENEVSLLLPSAPREANWLYLDHEVILEAQHGEWETLSKSVSTHRTLQSKAVHSHDKVCKHQLPELAPWPCCWLFWLYTDSILMLAAKVYWCDCKDSQGAAQDQAWSVPSNEFVRSLMVPSETYSLNGRERLKGGNRGGKLFHLERNSYLQPANSKTMGSQMWTTHIFYVLMLRYSIWGFHRKGKG